MAFKINEYFNGSVKSIGFTSVEGPATVGVMAPGEYEFTTATRETMRIVSGTMSAKLPDREAWVTCDAGQSFVVEANKKFTVRVTREAAYLCLFG